MQSPSFPKSVAREQTREALRLLGIETKDNRIVSVTIGVYTVEVSQNAVDANGDPYLAENGVEFARDVNVIAIGGNPDA